MRFLIDANLPHKLSPILKAKGFDVIHTDDLPNQERTTDAEIRKASIEDDRIIITKDTDFLDSHIIKQIPSKLLLVTTGNINNNKLRSLFNDHFETIVKLFDHYDLIEIDNSRITGHEK